MLLSNGTKDHLDWTSGGAANVGPLMKKTLNLQSGMDNLGSSVGIFGDDIKNPWVFCQLSNIRILLRFSKYVSITNLGSLENFVCGLFTSNIFQGQFKDYWSN